ncbi:hypothetical protein [Glycomyces harbinensis]|uniref:Uncharacterized protein n=1 Tax=Glycomyces harbinensis TaxID=58114 RepID=A0A1G6YAI4_9ACTN|nr:hypothetical protein [Glycomyces harbinensis]SDD87504.1 hypothetical protein SAMN05216270_108233 [Glycomyces harbinensis]
MTSTTYPDTATAAAAVARDFPDATRQPVLTEVLGDEVRFDAASSTVIEIRDHSGDQLSSTNVDTFPGGAYAADLGVANLLADRIEATRRGRFDPALLAAVLAELTAIATASIPAERHRRGDDDADTAWELYNRYTEARERYMVAEALLNRHTRLMSARLRAEGADVDTIQKTVSANNVEEVIDRLYADQRIMRELP